METKAQRFLNAFERGTHGLTHPSAGACPGCAECGLSDVEDMNDPRYEMAEEASFSWSACDICGSRLGGDRAPAHGVCSETGEIVHMSVCVDCTVFLANGDTPDEWEG